MKLNELSDNPGARTSRKRLGRGIGSGLGKTSGKGHKGAKARRSNPKPRYFEGGQMPIYRRVPKRGFQNPTRVEYAEVNIGRLQKAIEAGRLDAGKTVDAEALIGAGLVRRALAGIRLLGQGDHVGGDHRGRRCHQGCDRRGRAGGRQGRGAGRPGRSLMPAVRRGRDGWRR